MADEIPLKPPGACVYSARTRNEERKHVWKVALGCANALPSGEHLNAMRKSAAMRREQMLAFQKECGSRGDRDGARFFKDEAADALKEYRAACLVVPYVVEDPPGDCVYRPEWEWPTELAPWVDRVIWLENGTASA